MAHPSRDHQALCDRHCSAASTVGLPPLRNAAVAELPPGNDPMGPWGLHYERTQTWWAYASVAPVRGPLPILAEAGTFRRRYLRSFSRKTRRKISPGPFGAIGTVSATTRFLSRRRLCSRARPVGTRTERLVLPDGMSYRILALSDGDRMTPPPAKFEIWVRTGRRWSARDRSVHRAWPTILNADGEISGWQEQSSGRLRRQDREGTRWAKERSICRPELRGRSSPEWALRRFLCSAERFTLGEPHPPDVDDMDV